ncbi:MAG: formylglycine-generating enzyme family protein [Candidatus Omnitrophica bacterium]|nr:formylglycine-generating enzyme family protein [Candidatus Omnitrophota bacterium]
MHRLRQIIPIYIIVLIAAAAGIGQSETILYDFSGNSADENGISIKGAGFGVYTAPDVAFGSIPTDNGFENATDGKGIIILADGEEGAMILPQEVKSDKPAFLRCSVRATAPHISVYLASIDQSQNQFVSTITPNTGSYFLDRYKRISNFVIPPSSGFQPIIQIVNTSPTEPVTVYLDNFEIHLLEPGQYYSTEFIDGDESDPAEIAITPFIPSPTPTPTSTPTPEPTATFTPTPSPTNTPTPTLTPTPTPLDYGWIEFSGSIRAADTGLPMNNVVVKIEGDSIQQQIVLSDSGGDYNIDVYGYLYDFYQISAEASGYNTYQTLSNYDPREPQIQVNDIRMTRIPGPTPTPMPRPDRNLTIDLGVLPEGAKPLEMIWIPPGMFQMGSPENEIGRSNDETRHSVSITRGFYLGKYEITQAQWQAVMNASPSNSKGINKPVETISWIDANAFVDKLNKMNQGTFRLPTEAEWEYACRAGTATRFYWGEDSSYTEIGNYAWYDLNAGLSLQEVGVKLPNAWGLYDMIGNVFEWCSDYYGEYPTGLQIDPSGPSKGAARVRRGGSWLTLKESCRSAARGSLTAYMKSQYIGVRILREHP